MKSPALAASVVVGWAASCCLPQTAPRPFTRHVVHATQAVTLSLPVAQADGEHLFLSATGKWRPLPDARYEDGVLTFTLRPEQLRQGETILLLGKPAWLDADDREPPKATRVLVDGEVRDLVPAIDLGWIEQRPQEVAVEFEDDRNPLDASSVRAIVNGVPRRADGKAIRFEPDPKDDHRGRVTCSVAALLGDRPLGNTRLVVECDDFAPDWERAAVAFSFTVTDPAAIRLDEPAATTADGTEVYVDSIFAGYENVECLLDGKLQPPGASTAGCSWASADSDADHWVCFVFPERRALSGLKIDWAQWKDTYWTSSRFEIMTWDGRAWQRALRVQGNPSTSATTHAFAPCETDRLLIWQPSMGGHPGYPGILWTTEVTFLP